MGRAVKEVVLAALLTLTYRARERAVLGRIGKSVAAR